MNNIQIILESVKHLSYCRLGEHINVLIFTGDESDIKGSRGQPFAHKMKVKFDKFRTSVYKLHA
jgi:hypothetical protein